MRVKLLFHNTINRVRPSTTMNKLFYRVRQKPKFRTFTFWTKSILLVHTRKQVLAGILSCIFILPAVSQVPVDLKEDLVLSGFEQKVSGSDFQYTSSVPNVRKAMIVRAINGKQSAEWTTQAVPGDIKPKYVSFVWLAGIGNSPGRARMDVMVDGVKQFEFYTHCDKAWKQRSDNGSELYFKADMTDGNGDDFGFMVLRIPKQNLTPGKSLTVKIKGSNSGKQSWFMIFQESVKSGLKVSSYPAILRGKGQVIGVSFYYFGKPVKGTVFIDGTPVKKVALKDGYNYCGLNQPAVKKKTSLKISLKAGKLNDALEIALVPVRKWRVNFVQHTHTDIGYTRPQTEILAEHLRFIDYALDYCDATDTYSSEEQFRWTCEAAWAVDEYLRSRPESQIKKLKRRIREGRIEVTGMYFNFDELPDEQTLASSLQPLKRFRKNGIKVTTAMQDDVNGIGWCFSDYFNGLGVKYLNMGTHGHRALIPFDLPTAFWWESPSGKRMLAFRAEHYMFGNMLGVHGDNFEQFENKLLHYLQQLGEKGYPFDVVAIQHSGYVTDNSPPSTHSSEMIRKWNEKYEWPKLKTAVVSEFFEEIEAKHARDLPVYRGAWPDWWTDGFASGAREAATSRNAHTDIIASMGALSLAALMGSNLPEGITGRIDEANKALLFYDEHTFGYSESVRDPYGESTMEQRALKESYAWEAYRRAKMLGEEAMGLLQEHVKKEHVPILAVFNTLGWGRSGVVRAYIDHQVLPRNKPFRILDKTTGLPVPVQAISNRSDGTYWAIWVEDVPAFGFKKFLIQTEHVGDNGFENDISWSDDVLENEWYRLEIDRKNGVATSLFDKELKNEMIDPEAKWKLGAFILEKLGNRSQMETYHLDDYKRFGLDSIRFAGYLEGPVWNTLHFVGETPTAYAPHGFEFEIRLFHTCKRIDFAFSIRKKPIIDPEGIYISFPFQLDDGRIFCEVQGGVMEAGKDQIPGSANDWNTVQNFAAVRNNKAQIVFGSPEIPLMQFGAINTGRYKARAKPESTKIYSWPMNNYWVTNFNADQRGTMRWTYYFTSVADTSNSFATHFGWGVRIPFPVRVIPAGIPKGNKSGSPVLTGIPDNILVVQIHPGERKREVLMQVRELDGNATTFFIKNNTYALTVRKSNVVGMDTGEDLYNGIEIKPYENIFLKIAW